MIARAFSVAVCVLIVASAATVTACRASPPVWEELVDYYALVGACEAADRLRGLTDENVEARRPNGDVGEMAVTLSVKIEWSSASDRMRGLHEQATYLARNSAAYAYSRPKGPLDKKAADFLDAAIRNSRDELSRLESDFGNADAIRKDAGDAVMRMLADEGSPMSVRDSVGRLVGNRPPT